MVYDMVDQYCLQLHIAVVTHLNTSESSMKKKLSDFAYV